MARPADDDDISLEGIEEIDAPLPPPPAPAQETPLQPAHYAAAAQWPQAPFVRLLDSLWKEREHGGVVELHLEGGATIAPDWWSRGQSTEVFGLFARQTDDGTYEMLAIAWPHIQRITVRALTELPGGTFEGT